MNGTGQTQKFRNFKRIIHQGRGERSLESAADGSRTDPPGWEVARGCPTKEGCILLKEMIGVARKIKQAREKTLDKASGVF